MSFNVLTSKGDTVLREQHANKFKGISGISHTIASFIRISINRLMAEIIGKCAESKIPKSGVK